MAKNDQILIDGIIDDRIQRRIPSEKRDEVFEFFVLEQLLKFADLSTDEIRSGWIDGRDDGGIDGFYVLVNDLLVGDARSFNWPRGKADLSLWVVNCKHHDTFKQATVDKLVATLSELLDLGRSSVDFQGRYSRELLEARERLLSAYRALATRISSFTVHVAYASRGNSAEVGLAVAARAEQTKGVVRNLFSNCEVDFKFVGAAELISLHRKTRRYSLELPFIECFAHGERYVLLSRLEDYANFVRDEEGALRRYLFDSNVRDFAGLNRVNEDIATSLRLMDGPDFWWLNNGVTILVTGALIAGKSIVLDDVQIVNGLQTTESIARYFSTGGGDPGQRAVLVKIVKTDDAAVRDAIIRATNNQTEVEQQSLHATDKIQRDIEQVLIGKGWYYDRRKNHYANQGVSPEKIISPLYLAAAFVGIIERHPTAASKLRQRFMRNPIAYSRVFSETHDIELWPRLASVVKYVDWEISRLRPGGNSGRGERFLKRWRYLVSLIVVSAKIGRFSFSSKEFVSLDLASMSSSDVKDVWKLVRDTARSEELEDNAEELQGGRVVPRVDFVRRVCVEAAGKFSILDPEAVERSPSIYDLAKLRGGDLRSVATQSSDFLDRVDVALPLQPWKPGVHGQVAQALGCSPQEVSIAIKQLITQGRRNHQRDGVVYDQDGRVIAIDADRAG